MDLTTLEVSCLVESLNMITDLSTTCHWTLSGIIWNYNSFSHSTFLKLYFNIFFLFNPVFTYCLFPRVFRSVHILYSCLLPAIHALYPLPPPPPSSLIFCSLSIITLFAEEYKLWISSLSSFLQPPITSFVLGKNISLNTFLHLLSTFFYMIKRIML